jgi:hypothetical protein
LSCILSRTALNPVFPCDVKVGVVQGMVQPMKFLATAAWAVLMGFSLSACVAFTFPSDDDNKPPYGQSDQKSGRSEPSGPTPGRQRAPGTE